MNEKQKAIKKINYLTINGYLCLSDLPLHFGQSDLIAEYRLLTSPDASEILKVELSAALYKDISYWRWRMIKGTGEEMSTIFTEYIRAFRSARSKCRWIERSFTVEKIRVAFC